MIRKYTQTSPVLFGVGAVEKIGEEAKALGGTRALCVYDTGVKVSGIAQRLIDLLQAAGIETEVFDGVTPDPTTEQLDALAQRVRTLGVDIVIGIGGGSSLDTAKALSVLNASEGSVRQYLLEYGGSFEKASPLILVPTASGTGAESTPIGVLVDSQTHGKVVVPRGSDLSIVDPALTLTVPAHITAATGMDALAQAIEAYTSANNDPRSDTLALKSVKLIVNNIEKAVQDGNNLEARINMSLASNLAGIAFADASVHFGHAISHEFGSAFKMPHGIGCALALPIVLEVSLEANPERAYELFEALGLADAYSPDASGKTLGVVAADHIRGIMKRIGIKSLKEQEITREDAVACARSAHEKNWFVSMAPVEVSVPMLGEFIGRVYDGYQ